MRLNPSFLTALGLAAAWPALGATPNPLLSNNGFVVTLFGGVYNSTPPALLNTQTSPFQLDSSGNLKVNVVTGGGGGGGGGGSTFGVPFPVSGQAIGGLSPAGNLIALGVDYSNNAYVNLRTPLPAGSNVIGSVMQNGAWTVGITGTVPLPTGAAQAQYQGGIYNASAPVLSSGQMTALQVDNLGNLKVNVVTGGGGGGSGGGTSSLFTSAFPISGTAIGASNNGNMVALGADGASNLNVDLQTALPAGSNVIGAVAQSGTWNTTVATALPAGTNTIGAVAQGGTWSVNVIGTLPPISGSATAVLQSSVQGSPSGGTAAVASLLTGGVYSSSPPTLTGGQQTGLQVDANGNLKIAIASGGGSGGTASSFGLAFPSVGTAIGAKNGGNMVGLNADVSGNLQVNIQSFSGMATAANQTSVIGSVAAGTAANSAELTGAVYNATQPSAASGQQVAVQADSHGNLRQTRGVVTKVPLDVATVTTGGTAVTALTAGHSTAGGWIFNPDTATYDLCINEIGTASGTTSAGSTTCIEPNTTYAIAPGSGAVSVISADSAHAFSGMGYQ